MSDAPVSDARPQQPSPTWSLRRRVGTASGAVFALMVVVFGVVVVSVIQLSSKGDEVINRWQPAYTLSQNVLADLVNQETGIRGYALGKSETFLQPYTDYRTIEERHVASLRGYVAGRSELERDLDDFQSAVESWRRNVAAPFIARVHADDPTVAAAATSDRAKASFDRIRATAATLSSDLRATREDAKSARITAIHFVWASIIAAAVLMLLAGFAVWRGLRKTVLEPIDALGGQTRVVAAGAIDRTIHPSGPPELASLGRDVDTMRARIANELARVERARVVLTERGEELARSNADLEQFAYVASHDLSEPLRKVANFCQLLERQYADQLDDKARQYIAFAVDGAKRMQVLISDLLAFSRVGRTTESFERVDLNKALTRALATLEDRIGAASAEIVRGELPTVSGDATLLTALFQNLVGNALKYRSPDRTPRIEVSAERRGEEWQLTVSDNGIGIDPQYAERIFTIFQRLHLRDKYGGTGIGLALCRKIVEFHRGRIWLGESAAFGATFHVLIPEHLESRSDLPDELREPVSAL